MAPGDTLWGIAKRFLGSGTWWPAIYDTNKSVIEKTAQNHGLTSSDRGHWIFPKTHLRVHTAGLLNRLVPQTGQTVENYHPDCKKTFLIAARGSGENPSGPNNLGGSADEPSALSKLYEKLNSPVGSTGVYGVPYAATDALTFLRSTIPGSGYGLKVPDSTEFGAIQLAYIVRSQAEACPDQKIFLAGYSQGALVVRAALHLLSPDIRARINGIAFFGDPAWVGPTLPSDLTGRTTSQCAKNDPVCDRKAPVSAGLACLAGAAKGGLLRRLGSTCPHFSYSGGAADLAAAFLKAQIR
ncbi:cutinase family protein [Streptomyces sp. NPDC005790]|uniref:cutinase family protein n=1 Tax=Streptomyces sp. NPDC005790 TaxID=3154777 RepID=UPI0033FC1A9A